jgi:uncharacterized protein with PIN domain
MADVKICDRCKKIFENKKHWIYVHPERYILDFITLAWANDSLEEYEKIDKRFDLCPDCMEKLVMFLHGRPLIGYEE